MKKLFYMKRHNFIFSVIFIFCIVLIAVMNFVVNPYSIFNHNYNFLTTYDTSCDTHLVWPKMKFTSNNKYDYLLTGPSALETSINETRLKKLFPDKPIYKLTIDAVTVPEQYDLVKNFIKVHPEVKKIFVAVEFDEMANRAANRLSKYTGNKLNIRELCFLLLSADTTKFSLSSISFTTTDLFIPSVLFYLKNNEILSNFKFIGEYKYKEYIRKYPRVRYKDWWTRTFFDSLYDDLKKIKDLCEENNKEVVFYVSPLHANVLYDILFQGQWYELERFKKKFASITPFMDFLYVCEITNEPISHKNPYWVNPLHGDLALGDLMMKKLILGEGTYGVQVTEENVKSVLKENEKALFDYIRNNKKALDEYTSYRHLDYTADTKIIYHE